MRWLAFPHDLASVPLADVECYTRRVFIRFLARDDIVVMVVAAVPSSIGVFLGPVCQALQNEASDYARVAKLCGKKLTCKEMTKIKVRKFNNGVMTDELTERDVPVLEYA